MTLAWHYLHTLANMFLRTEGGGLPRTLLHKLSLFAARWILSNVKQEDATLMASAFVARITATQKKQDSGPALARAAALLA